MSLRQLRDGGDHGRRVVAYVLVIGEYARAGRRARPFLALSLGVFGLSSAVFAALFVGVFLDDRVDLGDRLPRRTATPARCCYFRRAVLFESRLLKGGFRGARAFYV
jgi:hypothetical protein